MQALNIRSRLVASWVRLVNQIRGLLGEHGVVVAQAMGNLRRAFVGAVKEATAMLVDHLKINQDIAVQSLPAAVGNGGGMFKDARFDMHGFKNVLKLRAEFGDTGKAPGKPETYVDLSYYRRAHKGI